jgi:hypothetical protein
MPTVSDDILDNMTKNGQIFENQAVFLQIKSINEENENEVTFNLQYIIKDRLDDTTFQGPLKILPLHLDGTSSVAESIQFKLKTSPSFSMKKAVIIAAVAEYNQAKTVYYDFLQIFDQAKIDVYTKI